MTMILRLIKINITAMFAGAFRFNKRKKKLSPVFIVLIALLAIYCIGALMMTSGLVFNQICIPFFAAGIGWFYFAIAGIYVFALCFITGVFMVQPQIFSAKDNELLLSMPIKPSAILTGRLSALLLMEYLFEALIMVPVFVVLIFNGCISALPVMGIVYFFLTALLLPFFALSLGCLVGWLVALAISRMRRKNILTLILSLGFLVAYFWLYSGLMEQLNTLIQNGVEIAEAVRKMLFPMYHLGIAITDGNTLSFIIFALCALVPFILMCYLLSVSFMKLAVGGRTAKKVVYREKTLRSTGARLALLRRELLHFLAQPMYIMNASLGAICALVIAVILFVKPDLLLSLFNPATGMLSMLMAPGDAPAIFLAALAAMNMISAPSISLEGKNLWIVKSLPVSARHILMSKAELHITVSGIPSLLAGVACIIFIPMNALQIIATLVLPAVVTLFFAFLGVTLNLQFPRFDWVNPVQPVKQGLSAMLSMFGGMALIMALVLVYVFLARGAMTTEVYLLICTGVFAAVAAGLYGYLAGAGCKRFESL